MPRSRTALTTCVSKVRALIPSWAGTRSSCQRRRESSGVDRALTHSLGRRRLRDIQPCRYFGGNVAHEPVHRTPPHHSEKFLSLRTGEHSGCHWPWLHDLSFGVSGAAQNASCKFTPSADNFTRKTILVVSNLIAASCSLCKKKVVRRDPGPPPAAALPSSEGF